MLVRILDSSLTVMERVQARQIDLFGLPTDRTVSKLVCDFLYKHAVLTTF